MLIKKYIRKIMFVLLGLYLVMYWLFVPIMITYAVSISTCPDVDIEGIFNNYTLTMQDLYKSSLIAKPIIKLYWIKGEIYFLWLKYLIYNWSGCY